MRVIGVFEGFIPAIEKVEEDGGSKLWAFSEKSTSELTSTSFEKIPAESLLYSRDTMLAEI